jgi:signal transduction histidine kinase
MTPSLLTRTFVVLFFALVPALRGETPDILRSAREVRALAQPQLEKSPPVLVSGVVLGLAEPEGKCLVLYDTTDSLYVLGTDETIARLVPGDTVEVRGHAVSGSYAPFVVADSVRKTGSAPVPEPKPIGLEELFGRGLDSQWISVVGVVRSLTHSESARYGRGVLASPWDKSVPPPTKRSKVRLLTLAIGDRLVSVQYYDALDADQLIDAEVEIRALCFNSHNFDRQFLQPALLIPRGVALRILRPPPAGPFALPVVSSRSLFQYRPEGFSLHRVHIDGVVLHESPGSGLWVRDHGHGLFVRVEQPPPLVPGDVVEVAGFPERGDFAPLLANAVCRKIGHEPEPIPFRLQQPGDEAFHDNDLVITEGTLVDRKAVPRGLLLRVQTRGRIIEVLCDGEPTAWEHARLDLGSYLSISGLCVLSAEGALQPSGKLIPDSYRLLVRRPSDIAVLRPAPWWTMQHVAILLGGVVVVLALILAAVFTLARKRIARERALRALEVSTYTARLAERNQMARDLHDTIAQGLTAISLQLEVAVKPEAPMEEVSRHVGLARQLVRTSMAEVRSFIRNLRTQTQQDVDLGAAIEEILRTAVEGASLRTRFRVDGDVRKLAADVETQILRITQEAVANAVQHSGASELAAEITYGDRSLEVVIADNGCGFEEAAASSGDRLHFGLVGMKERAALIGSALVIRSNPGGGTRIILSVPYHAVVAEKSL